MSNPARYNVRVRVRVNIPTVNGRIIRRITIRKTLRCAFADLFGEVRDWMSARHPKYTCWYVRSVWQHHGTYTRRVYLARGF